MSRESTTPDLLELVRRQLEAVNRGDLDAVMSFYARDSIWESPPLGTSFEGVTAIHRLFEDWTSAYEEYEMRLRRSSTSAMESCSLSFARTPVQLAALVAFRRWWYSTPSGCRVWSCG